MLDNFFQRICAATIVAGLLTSCGESPEEKIQREARTAFLEAERLYDQQDYFMAIANYETAAKLGNIDAQLKLAACYENGTGVKKDLFYAKKWYESAANQGDILAAYKVAEYYAGIGNTDNAIAFYEKAADKGHADSMYELYVQYIGMNKIDTALTYLQMAVSNNHQQAFYEYGLLASEGKYIAKDFGKAAEFIMKAAEKGYLPALYQLSVYYENGNLLEYSPSKAADYLERAAQGGFLPAQYKYACVIAGKGDHATAFNLFLAAANAGHMQAQFQVAGYMMTGIATQKNQQQALDWYLKAASQGYIPAMYEIGIYYEKRENLQEALRWLHKAVFEFKNLDDARAKDFEYRSALGKIYYKLGLLNEKEDFQEAWEYFLQAAEYDHAESQFIVGVNFFFGNDTIPRDRKKATYWLEKAIQNGHKFAQIMKTESNPNKEVVIKYIYAVSGNNDARYAYAQELLSGANIPKDEATAVHFLQMAVSEGHLDSIYQYAICHKDGIGLRPDLTAATRYLTQAAEAKHIKSMYLLGVWLYDEIISTKEVQEAAQQIQAQSVNININQVQGTASAQTQSVNININQIQGTASAQTAPKVVSDLRQEALKLWEEAAALGHVEAPIRLGDHYRNLNITEARYWYKIAAKSDNPKALKRLESLFTNFADAENYYLARAEDGESEAQAELAKLYFTGSTTSAVTTDDNFENRIYEVNGANWDQGRYWLLKAIEDENSEAEFVMGLCNYFGWAMEVNEREARSWFEKAAGKNHITAQFVMGIMNKNGIGGSTDEQEARNCFMQAALQGHPEAQRLLAQCYISGDGGAVDYPGAKFWYKALAAQGDAGAQKWLLTDASSHLNTDWQEWFKSYQELAIAGNEEERKWLLEAVFASQKADPALWVKYYKDKAAMGDAEAQQWLLDVLYSPVNSDIDLWIRCCKKLANSNVDKWLQQTDNSLQFSDLETWMQVFKDDALQQDTTKQQLLAAAPSLKVSDLDIMLRIYDNLTLQSKGGQWQPDTVLSLQETDLATTYPIIKKIFENPATEQVLTIAHPLENSDPATCLQKLTENFAQAEETQQLLQLADTSPEYYWTEYYWAGIIQVLKNTALQDDAKRWFRDNVVFLTNSDAGATMQDLINLAGQEERTRQMLLDLDPELKDSDLAALVQIFKILAEQKVKTQQLLQNIRELKIADPEEWLQKFGDLAKQRNAQIKLSEAASALQVVYPEEWLQIYKDFAAQGDQDAQQWLDDIASSLESAKPEDWYRYYKGRADEGDENAQICLSEVFKLPISEQEIWLKYYKEKFGLNITRNNELLSYTGDAEVCNIPDLVKSIAPNAFGNCGSLLHVTVPESITSIDPKTFSSCKLLKSIRLPQSIELKDTPFGCKIVRY